MIRPVLAASVLALMSAACASVPAAGPGEFINLPQALVDDGRVTTVTFTSDWLKAQEDFSDDFLDEVGEELDRCATGRTPLALRVHVDDYEAQNRLDTLIRGEGEHYMSGWAEFVDPASRQVVGRYRVNVAVQAGGRVRGLLADRQMVASEAFGRSLCLQAFGRNPEGPRITRSVPG